VLYLLSRRIDRRIEAHPELVSTAEDRTMPPAGDDRES
jgi:hypothetical protein